MTTAADKPHQAAVVTVDPETAPIDKDCPWCMVGPGDACRNHGGKQMPPFRMHERRARLVEA